MSDSAEAATRNFQQITVSQHQDCQWHPKQKYPQAKIQEILQENNRLKQKIRHLQLELKQLSQIVSYKIKQNDSPYPKPELRQQSVVDIPMSQISHELSDKKMKKAENQCFDTFSNSHVGIQIMESQWDKQSGGHRKQQAGQSIKNSIKLRLKKSTTLNFNKQFQPRDQFDDDDDQPLPNKKIFVEEYRNKGEKKIEDMANQIRGTNLTQFVDEEMNNEYESIYDETDQYLEESSVYENVFKSLKSFNIHNSQKVRTSNFKQSQTKRLKESSNIKKIKEEDAENSDEEAQKLDKANQFKLDDSIIQVQQESLYTSSKRDEQISSSLPSSNLRKTALSTNNKSNPFEVTVKPTKSSAKPQPQIVLKYCQSCRQRELKKTTSSSEYGKILESIMRKMLQVGKKNKQMGLTLDEMNKQASEEIPLIHSLMN